MAPSCRITLMHRDCTNDDHAPMRGRQKPEPASCQSRAWTSCEVRPARVPGLCGGRQACHLKTGPPDSERRTRPRCPQARLTPAADSQHARIRSPHLPGDGQRQSTWPAPPPPRGLFILDRRVAFPTPGGAAGIGKRHYRELKGFGPLDIATRGRGPQCSMAMPSRTLDTDHLTAHLVCSRVCRPRSAWSDRKCLADRSHRCGIPSGPVVRASTPLTMAQVVSRLPTALTVCHRACSKPRDAWATIQGHNGTVSGAPTEHRAPATASRVYPRGTASLTAAIQVRPRDPLVPRRCHASAAAAATAIVPAIPSACAWEGIPTAGRSFRS
jgi:hypothetical protein